jgi:hypothetical protein
MRIPSLSRLFIAFLLVICIFVIVIFTGEDNERHSTQIRGKFKKTVLLYNFSPGKT